MPLVSYVARTCVTVRRDERLLYREDRCVQTLLWLQVQSRKPDPAFIFSAYIVGGTDIDSCFIWTRLRHQQHALFDLRSRLFQIGEDGRKEKRFFDAYSYYIPRRNVIFSEQSIDQSYPAIFFVDGTRAGLTLFRPVSAFREAKEQNFRHYKNASLSSGNFAVLATMQICMEQVYAVCN